MARKQKKIENNNNNNNNNNNDNTENVFMSKLELNETKNMKKNELIDDGQRKAIENLATFVKQHGNALEQTVRDRSRNDQKFRFDAIIYITTNNNYMF